MAILLPGCGSQLLSAGTQTHGPSATNPGRESTASETQPCLRCSAGGRPRRVLTSSNRELLGAATPFHSFPHPLPNWILSSNQSPKKTVPLSSDEGLPQERLLAPSDGVLSGQDCRGHSEALLILTLLVLQPVPLQSNFLHPRLEIWVLDWALISLIQSSID